MTTAICVCRVTWLLGGLIQWNGGGFKGTLSNILTISIKLIQLKLKQCKSLILVHTGIF